jgi:hypothetical protein
MGKDPPLGVAAVLLHGGLSALDGGSAHADGAARAALGRRLLALEHPPGSMPPNQMAIYIIIIILLVIMAGLMAGLTLGLLSIDK